MLSETAYDGEFDTLAADVDGDGDILVTDATFIQRFLAEIEVPYLINEPITA